MSICQALESDEEEEESVSGRGRGVTLLPRAVSDPNELSSALMKALRVGEEAGELERAVVYWRHLWAAVV